MFNELRGRVDGLSENFNKDRKHRSKSRKHKNNQSEIKNKLTEMKNYRESTVK